MQIRKLLPTELAWANAQYESIQFSLSSEFDFAAVAEINGVKVGIGRITQVENDAGELGGMFVLPEFRGQSVAAGIVGYLLRHSEYATLFCIPFAHLDMFYRRFGFLPVEPTASIPQKIAKKIGWCAQTYESTVVLLCRPQQINDIN